MNVISSGVVTETLLNQATGTITIGGFTFCGSSADLRTDNTLTNQGQIALRTSFGCGSGFGSGLRVTSGKLENDATITTSGPTDALSALIAPVLDNRGTIQADQPLGIAQGQHLNSGTVLAHSDLFLIFDTDSSFTNTAATATPDALSGQQSNTKIGVLQVWQKQDGNWKLLARQGYNLA